MTQNFARKHVSLANWRNAPFIEWSFQNVREIAPTCGIGVAKPAKSQPVPAEPLADMIVDVPGSGRIAVNDHLKASNTDSIVVLRDGSPVAEWHGPHVDPDRPHIVFSVSKSITGMLAGIAVGDGQLDPEALVADYVPVHPGAAYADARVRHLLDMTVSLDFEEDYLNLDGPFDRYRRAMLWNPEREPNASEVMIDVLASLPRLPHPHGERFFYASPNTDMLGLVLENATSRRFADYLAEKLWRPMGARGEAYVTVDRIGSARAAGGVCVTARDLAQFGDLVLNRGATRDGQQVIPADWIADMRSNGDRAAWQAGNFAQTYPNGRYRSFWYDVGDERGCFAASGIHGQHIWIDPQSGVVIARTASRPTPSDDAQSAIETAVLSQVAAHI